MLQPATSLKRQARSDMDARTGPEAARDREPDAEERRGRPDSGANPFLEPLIAEPLTLVICRSGIHEDAVAKSRDSKRRCRRDSQLDRACDERVADGIAGAEPAKVARAAEYRLVEGRRRLAEIFPNGSEPSWRPEGP